MVSPGLTPRPWLSMAEANGRAADPDDVCMAIPNLVVIVMASGGDGGRR
jgi:hypothetical protein